MTFGHFCIVELTILLSMLKYSCLTIFYEFHLENRENTKKRQDNILRRFWGHVRIFFVNHCAFQNKDI